MKDLESKNFYGDSIKGKINDSANQFGAFKYFKDENEIKDLIRENPLMNLEDYIKINIDDIDKEYPEMRKKYNYFVNEFMDPSINYDRIKAIIKEVYELTHNL